MRTDAFLTLLSGFFFGCSATMLVIGLANGTFSPWFILFAMAGVTALGEAGRRCMCCALAFLFLAPAAHAETMLLELAWKQPNPVTLPVQYSVHVEDSSFFPNHGGWLETVFEWPHQSWAPEETVRALNLPMIESSQGPLIIFYVVDDHISGAGQQQPERGALGCNSCHFSRMMGQPDSGFSGEYWLQYVADQGWEVDLQVPLLGDTGLKGYWLTNVERLVTADKQTIRFYGNIIPEPASWVLVLCGLAIQWRKRWN